MRCAAGLGHGTGRFDLVVAALLLGAPGCFSDPGMAGGAGDSDSGGETDGSATGTGSSGSAEESGTGIESGEVSGEVPMDLGDSGLEETGADTGECVWIRFGENVDDDVGGATVDTWIDEEAPMMNNGSDDDLRADGVSAQGLAETSLIRFDVSSLPMGTVTDAVLHLSTNEDDGSESSPGSQFSLYEVREPWVEGESNWLQASAGVPWSVPGCAGDPCHDAGELAFFEPTEPSHGYALPFDPAIVAAWRNLPDENHGLLLATSAANGGMFHSSESNDDAMRPALEARVCP